MRLGKYRVNVLLRRIVYESEILTLDLYRIVILPNLALGNEKFKMIKQMALGLNKNVNL